MIKEAMLYERLDNNVVHCYLCNHHCRICDGKFGLCGVRQNCDGQLNTLVWGEVVASHVDPIEKKPLYHFLPGSASFSIATIGCNFRCGFCQNWQISQVSKRDGSKGAGYELKPEEIVREAKRADCKSISYTYTEPTIFFEYAYDTAKLARGAGLKSVFVTNGYMTKEAIETIKPYLDAANVDLKFFKGSSYKDICKAKLEPVLDSIRLMNKVGIWVEVTTLVIPGLNDSDEELSGIAKFLADVNRDIPWHLSAFHPDYKFTDYSSTPIRTLKNAYRIGKDNGLKFIYLGNVLEECDTICPECSFVLIKRGYMSVTKNDVTSSSCPKCNTAVPGVWD